MLSANAKEQVRQILGFTLEVAAPWPDCLRSVQRQNDGTFRYVPEEEFRKPCKSFEADHGASAEQIQMEDYVSRNWTNCVYIEGKEGHCHEAFHFADVPIQRGKYRRNLDNEEVGTSKHDVVHAINACIAVLQGHPAPAPFSIKDKKEALFLLAHFVGDLHQPLHVGSVYLSPVTGQRLDPDQSGLDKKSETAGGNFIFIAGEKLHHEWDSIPASWGHTPDDPMMVDARKVSDTPGPITGWVASWASETVMKARDAFPEALTFSAAGTRHWNGKIPDKHVYDKDAEKVKREQLAKGGARLAHILNSIWP